MLPVSDDRSVFDPFALALIYSGSLVEGGRSHEILQGHLETVEPNSLHHVSATRATAGNRRILIYSAGLAAQPALFVPEMSSAALLASNSIKVRLRYTCTTLANALFVFRAIGPHLNSLFTNFR